MFLNHQLVWRCAVYKTVEELLWVADKMKLKKLFQTVAMVKYDIMIVRNTLNTFCGEFNTCKPGSYILHQYVASCIPYSEFHSRQMSWNSQVVRNAVEAQCNSISWSSRTCFYIVHNLFYKGSNIKRNVRLSPSKGRV